MQAAVKQGRFPWVAPLGYTNVKNGASNLSVDPARALLVRKAFELIGSGNYGPDEARRVVVALGLRTKNGNVVTKQTFSRMIRNELYAGWVVSGQLRAKGAHEPLISEQLFHDVQDTLNGKRSVPHKRESEEFPLRGFVRCASCNKPLTAGWSRGRSQKYARYWCWTKDCGAVGIRRDKLEHHFTELLYLHQPTQELLDALPKIAQERWKVRKEQSESERRQLNTRLADATTLHRKAVEALLGEKLSQDDLDAIKVSTEADKAAITERLKALESEEMTMESLIEQARREVVDLEKTWNEAGLKQRQELQRVVFPEGLAYSILALLTRETPAEIAAERKSLRKILEASASQANAVEKRMEEYTSLLESRLTHLPKELETGLDPPRIAKLLGESLRQCFQRSGLPDTARALDQCCSEMNSVQEQLVNVLREVAHPDIGVIEKVRSANDSLLRSMTTRAQQMDDFLVRLEKQVWSIWLPVVASAALALGFALGTWFANVRQGTPETSSATQSQQMPMPEAPAQQVVPQRNTKHH
ncbi:MAG: recombinase family protein [Candidatus Sulfotelmatobacter sp.]